MNEHCVKIILSKGDNQEGIATLIFITTYIKPTELSKEDI